MPEKFVQVILPLSLHDSFTYRVPESMHSQIQTGQRVIVQFGKKRLYAALVLSISNVNTSSLELKEVLQILDKQPIVFQKNFELWNWIASYYCCSLGDVFRAAIPTGLKLESKSKVFLTGDEKKQTVSENELAILGQLKNGNNFLFEIQKNLGLGFSFSALKSLTAKNLIYIEEKISKKYRPKTETFIRLHPEITSEEQLTQKTDGIKRAKKQVELLYHFCSQTKAFESDQDNEISKNELLSETNFSQAVLNGLVKRKVLQSFQKQISRIENEENAQTSINLLNQFQEKALNEIKTEFETKTVSLIHGITASGKTEIYIHLIDEILKQGKQALYLVPEIALTTQIIKRLKNVFGNKVGIYHSKLNSHITSVVAGCRVELLK